MEPNHIYQYSLLNALMDGVSSTGLPAPTLLQKGTQGIGTFARMHGELLMLDNHVYQLQASGSVREADASDRIPFAVVTTFVPEATREVELPSKGAIDAVLEAFAPEGRNLFMSYRIDGAFAAVKCRTVRGQTYEGQPLSELGKTQSVEEYEGVSGTIVGFRTPRNWQGFGVAGEHLHFIDEGRRRGGHVLEVRGQGRVRMGMAVGANVHVELPRGGEFARARLETDDEGVREVEG